MALLRPGFASLEEEAPAPLRGPEPEVPAGGLCVTCSHAAVCAVRAAIRSVGGEGLIAVGACPSHDEAPRDTPEEPSED